MPFSGSHFLKGQKSKSLSNASVSQQIYIGLFQGLSVLFSFLIHLTQFPTSIPCHLLPPLQSTFLFTDLWVHPAYFEIRSTQLK